MLDPRRSSRRPRTAARRLTPTVRGWIVVGLVALLVVGLLAAAGVTTRRVDQAVATAELARQEAQEATRGQRQSADGEAYTRATRSLAADEVPERLGAVNVLRRVAVGDTTYATASCDTLTGFVTRTAPTTGDDEDRVAGPDVVAALSVLGRDCEGGRRFTGIDLSGADLADSVLQGLVFRSSTLADAALRSADLSGTTLVGTSLRQADLRYANLTGAALYAVDLTGAQLAAARLEGVRYDDATRWPSGFTPPASAPEPTD